MQRWGLPDDFWALAAEPRQYVVRRYSGGILVLENEFNKTIREKYGAPFIEPHRIDFQKALYTRAKELGVEFQFGMRISNINFDTGEMMTQSGEKARGDLVVAADGLWSLCRAQLLPRDFEGVPRPTGDLAYRLVLTLDQIQDPELREWVSRPACNLWIGPRSHVVGYSLRGGMEFNLVLITPDDLPSGVSRQAGSAEEMRALFTDWDPILNRFLAVVDSVKKWKLMHREYLIQYVTAALYANTILIRRRF